LENKRLVLGSVRGCLLPAREVQWFLGIPARVSFTPYARKSRMASATGYMKRLIFATAWFMPSKTTLSSLMRNEM